MSSVRVDFAELERIRVVLERCRGWRVRVGILGSRRDRFSIFTSTSTVDKLNNPTLGLIHEFGSKSAGIPARSFLRVPLLVDLPKKLEQIGKAVWRHLILSHSLERALQTLGVMGENTVQQAFNVGGPGWAPLAASTIRRKQKNKTAILIDSGQLKRSITSAVVKTTP